MRYLLILPVAVIMVFAGCKSGTGTHDGHDHEIESHESHDHETDSGEMGDHGDEIIFTREQARAAGLVVETIEPGAFGQVIKTSGKILSPPGEKIVIAAASSGMVSLAGTLTGGAAIAKGQTIATISAQNIVDGDPVAKVRIEYEAAEREYRRAERLVEDRIISERDFSEARRRYETARAALPSGVMATGVSVTSPLAGYVENLFVASGEYVSVGHPIATVTTNGKLLLRAEVSERWFDALPSIAGANFKTAYGDTIYHADRLLSYGHTAEGAYIPVTFEFDNAMGVAAGAYAEVWLLGAPLENVISVPKTALSEQQGLYFVYVALDEEGYQKREVALGADNGERVRITKGLEAGDRVVTHGTTQVRLAAMSGIIPEGHSH